MNEYTELSLLHELTYESNALIMLFQREKNRLKQIYGNKWLLCINENGKLRILEHRSKKGDLEALGFSLCGNKIFDVLNPSTYTNYKDHYSTVH